MPKSRFIAALAAIASALILLPASASALKFEPGGGGPLAQVGQPSDIATGDFNGDGLEDLAVASGSSPDHNPGINVLPATGGGDFGNAVRLDAGANGYFALVVGNFTENDSNLDIVGFQFVTGAFNLFAGNGDGTFAPLQSMNSSAPLGARNAMAVGDLNEDGVDDIVIGGLNGSYAVGIAQGNGQFNFTGAPVSTGQLASVTTGDFNNDNHVDVAFGDNEGKIWSFPGDGSGSLTPAEGNPVSIAGGLSYIDAIVAADFNGDGLDDVGASARTSRDPSWQTVESTVQTFLATNDGSLIVNPNSTGSVFSPGGDGPKPYTNLVTADFDNNGVGGDLAYLSKLQPNGPSQYYSEMRLSNGSGGFAAAAGSPFNWQLNTNESHNPWGQATGDFNGDEAPDLTIADPGGGLCSGCAAPVLMNFADVSSDPASIEFGDTWVGDQTTTGISVSNSGAPEADITSFAITGDNAGQFSIDYATACQVKIGVSCEREITFTPTSTGAKSATLTISNQDGPNLTVSLSGIGTQPAATFNPSGIVEFQKVNVGTTSPTQTVTVTSSGTTALKVGEVAESNGDSGSFEIVTGSDTCSQAVLDPGETCELKVVFAPDLALGLGTKNLNISVPSNARTSAQQVMVRGTSVDPQMSVTPTSKDFGTVAIGEPDSTQVFTISSTGPGGGYADLIVNVSDVTITGKDEADFSLESPVGCGTVVPGSSCTVTVHFRPQEDNGASRTATLNIASNATGSPTEIELTGTATYGDFTLSPEPIDFGEQRVGFTSPVKLVTLTSTGTAPLKLTPIGGGGDDTDQYSLVSDSCSNQTIPIGGTCQIGITMTPTRTGDLSDFGFGFGYPGGSNGAQLLGTGIDPDATLSPDRQDFGPVTVGETGPGQVFRITSTGTTPITVVSAAISGTDAGSFKLDDATACNGVKEPSSHCNLSISFTPQNGASPARSAELTVVTNAGSFTSNLSGTAVAIPVPPPGLVKANVTLKSAKKVKRGKKLVVRVKTKNTGTEAITGITIAAKVPKKLAKKPKKIKISSLAVGQTVTRKLKIKVKKKARAGKKLKLKVTATAAGKKLGSASKAAKIKR